MPIMKAAKKAMRQSGKRQKKNLSQKRSVYEMIKEIQKLAASGNKDEARQKLAAAYAILDKGAKRNIFHAKRAARKKSQLAKLLK